MNGSRRINCRSRTALAQLAEIGSKPDSRPLVLLDLGDISECSRGAPAARKPAADAAPHIALRVRGPARHGVEPHLVAVVASSPDRVGSVGVHRRGPGDGGPAAVLVGVAILENPVALRALAGRAVLADLVARQACGRVSAEVTKSVLLPPALDRGLREDDVLVDAPLAGSPPKDVDGGAGEVAVDPRRQRLLRERVV